MGLTGLCLGVDNRFDGFEDGWMNNIDEGSTKQIDNEPLTYILYFND